ncbi:MAG: hypothetical protein IJN63_03880 [Clostridia bacterium]|nr:hypothetical protein [Clostridia bacterium]
MKRTVAFIVSVIMLFSVVSCGEGNNPPETTVPTTTEPATTTEAPVTTEAVTTGEYELDYLPDATYDGHEFVVLMTNLNNNVVIIRDFKWTEGGTVLDDAMYKRNLLAMETLDITINGIEDYRTSNTGLASIRKANSAGDSNYDMGIIATYDCGRLALTGDLCNLAEYGYIDLEQSWWDQNINRDLVVDGKLYFTTGDISLVTTAAMYNMVFNKDIFRDRNWEMPYDLVREGVWTFDKMKEYVLQVSDDLNGDEKRDSNDLYGMVYIHSSVIAALGAAGERLASVNENDEVVITLGTEKAERAVVSFIELTQNRECVYNGQTATGGIDAVQMFVQGHCLFRWIEHIGFPYFRDTELDYGILPLPKLDESQDRYYTPFGGWDAAFVCVPTSTEDVERTSAIIEYLAYTSSKIVTPAYYEKTLTGRYVRDNESHDMITIEIENRIFDIGYVYSIGNLTDMVENLSKSYSTAFASRWKAYQRGAELACKNVNKTLHKEEE